MKVRAVDIARELNISKATVSLALNNKPGVSSRTRQAVFACLDRLQNSTVSRGSGDISALAEKSIKIIVVSKRMKIICDPELGIWNDVFQMFKKELDKLNYKMSIEYVDFFQDDLSIVINECNGSDIAGVILYATEINEYDFDIFRQIKKPMIVFDNDLGKDYHSVVIDNSSAIQEVVTYLVGLGYRDIQYLSQSQDIYNFLQRRAGFREGFRKNYLKFNNNMIIPVGTTIENISEFMSKYLISHPLPEVFVMENYHVSVGVMNALKKLEIRVPKDVSLVGVDALPDFVEQECTLKTVNIEHSERAIAAVMLLQKEIENYLPMKFHVFVKCALDFGNSVSQKV